MVHAKSELFTNDLIELSNFSKALKHPEHIHILKFSAQSNSFIADNISDEIPLNACP